MEPFRFAIALPRDADSLPLLGALCDHVARLVGLSDRAARQRREELEQVVRERLNAEAEDPIEVAFERKAGDPTVIVEVTNVTQRFRWEARRAG